MEALQIIVLFADTEVLVMLGTVKSVVCWRGIEMVALG